MKEENKNEIQTPASENETAPPDESKSEEPKDSKQNSPEENDSSNNADEAENDEKPKKKNRLPLYIGGVVLLIAAIGGFFYWLHARQFESTDDAFIEGDIVQVSPKISAYVTKVLVKENQQVHKGDLLVELDTKDLEARLEAAQAQLKSAQAQVAQSQASVDLTRKTVQAGPIGAGECRTDAPLGTSQTKCG